MITDISQIKEKKFIKDIKKTVTEQTGLTDENSNLDEAINDGISRNKMYKMLELKKAAELSKEGKEPYPCFNSVCESCSHASCLEKESCHGCIFQMLSPPPNSLSYNEYMPSHKEALDRLENNNLISGNKDDYAKDNVSYGKLETQSERKNVLLDGVPIFKASAALRNCLKQLSGFTYGEEEEIGILTRNFEVELEKVLGIYPNIKCL